MIEAESSASRLRETLDAHQNRLTAVDDENVDRQDGAPVESVRRIPNRIRLLESLSCDVRALTLLALQMRQTDSMAALHAIDKEELRPALSAWREGLHELHLQPPEIAHSAAFHDSSAALVASILGRQESGAPATVNAAPKAAALMLLQDQYLQLKVERSELQQNVGDVARNLAHLIATLSDPIRSVREPQLERLDTRIGYAWCATFDFAPSVARLTSLSVRSCRDFSANSRESSRNVLRPSNLQTRI